MFAKYDQTALPTQKGISVFFVFVFVFFFLFLLFFFLLFFLFFFFLFFFLFFFFFIFLSVQYLAGAAECGHPPKNPECCKWKIGLLMSSHFS